MSHILELRKSTSFRSPFLKLALFVLFLGAGEVNGQTVHFSDSFTSMSTADGVNYTLSNYDGNSYGLNCYFYSDFDGTYYVGTVNGSGVAVPDAWGQIATLSPVVYQSITFNINTHEYHLTAGDCSAISNSMSLITSQLSPSNLCSDVSLNCSDSPPTSNWSYQWMKNGQNISGANSVEYIASASNSSDVYSCQATCNTTGQTVVTNTYTKSPCSSLNYMLIQNVTVTGINTAQGTAQVQFDINWGNSWKDSINWDAAWVFMKYKNAAGQWKHAKINATGYDHGQGTNNIIQPTADKMGAFVRMSDYGQTNFSVDGMQLQWNFGMDGMNNVSNVEVKLFATEMVYMPQGEFNAIRRNNGDYDGGDQNIIAPGNNAAVINTRLTPILSTGNGSQFRVKGDAGLDSNADGTIDAPNYPTGYTPFYAFKCEMSEQLYADFLNCLTLDQQTSLGAAGSSISLNNGVYYAASPNQVCYGFSNERFLAFSDWSGLRPLSVLEFSKAVLGPKANHVEYAHRDINGNIGLYDVGRIGFNAGSGYYGMRDAFASSANEPMVNIGSSQFSKLIHGDGILAVNGLNNQISWSSIGIILGNGPQDNPMFWIYNVPNGFRFARTAE